MFLRSRSCSGPYQQVFDRPFIESSDLSVYDVRKLSQGEMRVTVRSEGRKKCCWLPHQPHSPPLRVCSHCFQFFTKKRFHHGDAYETPPCQPIGDRSISSDKSGRPGQHMVC